MDTLLSHLCVCCRVGFLQVMMLLAWQQMTTSTSRNSAFDYWQLAGVHGKSWTYNGVDAPSS